MKESSFQRLREEIQRLVSEAFKESVRLDLTGTQYCELHAEIRALQKAQELLEMADGDWEEFATLWEETK